MPPKPKFSKEEIIDAALDIVSRDGVAALTARELGEKLETSVDPAERKAAWGEMLKVFSQNPWACPLYSLPMLYAKQKNVVWEASALQGSLDLSAENLSFQ